jgi:hypothetical protein
MHGPLHRKTNDPWMVSQYVTFIALENIQCWSAAFLDISQEFEKVWHTGLLYKLRLSYFLIFLILKFYLHSRNFFVTIENEHTELFSTNVGVPQGSVLGSLLYLLCIAVLPSSPNTTTASSTDGTAIVATDNDPTIALRMLQANLLANQKWLKMWRMKANGSKSIQVTFTTRKDRCHLSTYTRCSISSRSSSQMPRIALRQKTYLEKTCLCKTETTTHHDHKNLQATRPQVKIFYQ